MNWFVDLFVGSGLAHSIMILSLVITIGILLGRVKIAGISLGITWILFAGIAFGHFNMGIDEHICHFLKEFGLILFVYSIGLQVGPSFFSSFKKGGVTLNLLATGIVFIGVVTTYIVHLVTGENLVTMVGVLSGAVTNTPGLGAAQQTFSDMGGDPAIGNTIPMGYAVAYPLGVVGIIATLLVIRFAFRIKLNAEQSKLDSKSGDSNNTVKRVSAVVKNPAIFGKTIVEISELVGKSFVFSRLCHEDGKVEIPKSDTRLNNGDRVLIITTHADEDAITAFVGERIDMAFDKWEELDKQMVIRRIFITRPEINGKRLADLKIRTIYGVNITRITRAGVDLMPYPGLKLQLGDRILAVGAENDINQLSSLLGNSLNKLNEPHLIPIFLGIALGVIFGSIPFVFPGIPQPVKLGLAGGPLIISILISYFGPKYRLVTYNTISANVMLREIGISLFLAAVGLSAGEGFVDAIVNGGYKWIGYGVIITIVPILLIGIIARLGCKLNYFTIMGLIAGSTTDPPALAYSNSVANNPEPSVAYATVYPLTMFLRVLTAQLLVLLA